MTNSKILLLFLTLAIARLSAQLPAGTVAPDFLATDVNGQNWHLYDLLAQDKIVILEFGATWCSPCWAYHNGGALQEFYAAHGPNGDGRVEILFIESDPNTNLACLYGQANCNNQSLGNWVSGVPFPVINNDYIATAYQLSYYPTLFVICPNQKIYEVGQFDAEKLWGKATQCPVAFGSNNAGIFEFYSGTDLDELCGNQPLAPSFKLTNLGANTLSSALIELRWNNMPVQNMQWLGYLPLYGEAEIHFDPFELSGAGTLESAITQVNDLPNEDDTTNNTYQQIFVPALNFNDTKIVLKLRTDNFGAETYWELRDDAGNVLDHGGNEAVGPEGGGQHFSINGGPGAYGNLAFIKDTLSLPEPGCYSIHFVDAYGDGICCGFGSGFYRLYDLDNANVPILSGGEFEAYDHRGFGAQGTTPAAEANTAWPELHIFPNPVTDDLQIDIQLAKPLAATITVFDAQGKMVYQENTTPNAGEQHWEIPVTGWSPGLYLLCWQVAGQVAVTRSFLVNR